MLFRTLNRNELYALVLGAAPKIADMLQQAMLVHAVVGQWDMYYPIPHRDLLANTVEVWHVH